jgi:polar amino acid transport system substrate-binding protein
VAPLLRSYVIALGVLVACDLPLPRDPGHTSERIASERVLRVGVSEHAPWVVRSPGGEPGGLEVQLVLALAREQGARVQWHWGQLESLFVALSANELDLAIAGIDADTPWDDRVGLTEPWYEPSDDSQLVLALPPGENRWLGTVDRFLHAHGAELRAHAGTR